MASKYRDIPFTSGASDDLAKIDVYKEKRVGAINDKTDKVDSDIRLAERLKNDPAALQKKVIDKLSTRNDVFGKAAKLLTKALTIAAIIKLLKDPKSFFGIDLSFIDRIQRLLGRDKRVKNKAKLNNGAVVDRTAEEVERYLEAVDQLDELSPPDDPIDPTAEPGPVLVPDPNTITMVAVTEQADAFSAIITEFIDLRDPSATAAAIARIKDPDVLKEVYLNISSALVEAGDLFNLDKMLDSLGIETVNALFPNLIKDLFSQFTLPEEITAAEFVILKDKLLAFVARVNPNWYLTPRGDSVIRNLKPYIYMSEDAKTLIALEPIHKPACMIADSYKEDAILDLFKTKFPLTPVGV